MAEAAADGKPAAEVAAADAAVVAAAAAVDAAVPLAAAALLEEHERLCAIIMLCNPKTAIIANKMPRTDMNYSSSSMTQGASGA